MNPRLKSWQLRRRDHSKTPSSPPVDHPTAVRFAQRKCKIGYARLVEPGDVML